MTQQSRPVIIAFASPKGGVGKSTMCACLGGALAARGYSVLVMDLDQNRTLERWARSFPAVSEIMTVEGLGEGEFMERLKHHCATRQGFILVDVAGVFQKTMIQAATVADVTITPAKLSAPDVIEAVKLSRELGQLSVMMGKSIRHRLLLNEVSSLWPTYQRSVLEDVKRSGVQGIGVALQHRAPFAEVFLSGQPPHYADARREPVRKAMEQLDAMTDWILRDIGFEDVKVAA
ncbi:ParA family protein [Hyphomicrobium sp. CS1BSMeth3]|uniref:ParA family protein n=1 Tax=Hyphomicrobium sp. CS1BSMeth3 TaxID=1892844 RepID=UPI000931DA22|nr:ParA family protein [Hyphomicrobium sp. CS1BSMeth3]